MRINLFFLIIIIALFISCDINDPERIYKFTIENQTSKNIKIRTFENNVLKREIFVNPLFNEHFTEVESGVVFTFHNIFRGDSIRIIYNNEKVKVFTCKRSSIAGESIGCNEDRNPYSDFVSQNGLNFIYTITENDYLNAEDCNGNCD